MTEDEAKTKWCPFVRYKFAILSDASAFNRGGHERDAENTRCIGSACMAWRWVEKNVYNNQGDLIGERVTTYGHCGLASAP